MVFCLNGKVPRATQPTLIHTMYQLVTSLITWYGYVYPPANRGTRPLVTLAPSMCTKCLSVNTQFIEITKLEDAAHKLSRISGSFITKKMTSDRETTPPRRGNEFTPINSQAGLLIDHQQQENEFTPINSPVGMLIDRQQRGSPSPSPERNHLSGMLLYDQC